MNKVFRTIMLGAALIVAYDTLTALLSAATGISYGLFSIGSFLIYILFGFLVGRHSRWYLGAVSGAVIALAESTIGWAISWYIGPGKPPIEIDASATVIGVIALVIPFGAFLGLIGGLLSLAVRRNA
jgi:hypothetical protein